MVMKMLYLNCIHQTWAKPFFPEWISHVCGICALQASFFLVDGVALFLTHIMAATVPLYEITGMWRHYQWYEVSQTQVFLQSLYRPRQALRVPCCQPYTLAARIMSMKNSNDTVGNQTHDLPAHSLNQLCHPVPPQTHITQFTFASTHCGKNICDRYQFCTTSEQHYSKHRTHNESLEIYP